MSDIVKLLVIINNYSHDFSAGLLLSSAVTLFLLRKELIDKETPVYLKKKIFSILSKVAFVSLVWIIIAGGIRTYYYKSFELNQSIAKGEVEMLLFKHLIFFIMTFTGIYFWVRLKRSIDV